MYIFFQCRIQNPQKTQTLILLPPQRIHIYNIWIVDYIILSLFPQCLTLLLFNNVGLFTFLDYCCTKLEQTYQNGLCKVDIILVPHMLLIIIQEKNYPELSHWNLFSKYDLLLHISNLWQKITLHCRIIGSVLVVYDVTPETLQPIIIHFKRILLVHIHLQHVPFILWRNYRYAFNEQYIILWYLNITFNMY